MAKKSKSEFDFTKDQITKLTRLRELYYILRYGIGLTDDEDEEAKRISEELEEILPLNY